MPTLNIVYVYKRVVFNILLTRKIVCKRSGDMNIFCPLALFFFHRSLDIVCLNFSVVGIM